MERPSTHTVSEEDMAKICFSLASAYQQAGGVIPSLDSLKNITAWEFIRRIAPNNIRFHYELRDDDEDS